jgi:hypothetical protein
MTIVITGPRADGRALELPAAGDLDYRDIDIDS